MQNRILRFKDLINKLKVSRSTIYNLIEQDDSFPRPIRLSKRAVGFCSESVDEWLELKAHESNGHEADS